MVSVSFYFFVLCFVVFRFCVLFCIGRVFFFFCCAFLLCVVSVYFFFSSRRRHTRCLSDWSSDVCSSDSARRQVRDELEGRLRHSGRARAAMAHSLARDLSRQKDDGRDRDQAVLRRRTSGRDRGREPRPPDVELGRASCRDSVESWVVDET